eukprot:5924128-Amphidinium_carterae.1
MDFVDDSWVANHGDDSEPMMRARRAAFRDLMSVDPSLVSGVRHALVDPFRGDPSPIDDDDVNVAHFEFLSVDAVNVGAALSVKIESAGLDACQCAFFAWLSSIVSWCGANACDINPQLGSNSQVRVRVFRNFVLGRLRFSVAQHDRFDGMLGTSDRDVSVSDDSSTPQASP